MTAATDGGADPLLDLLLKQDLGLVLYTREPRGALPLATMTPNAISITGFPPDRFLQDPTFWISRVHPDDRERILTDIEELFELGHHRQEYRWRVADGTYRWFEDVSRLGTARDGAATAIAGALRDITEQRRQAEAHRLSEARYRAVVEDQTELICRFLPDGTLSFVNRAFCQYFGKRVDELLGRSFIPLLPIEDREPMRRHLRWFSPERPIAAIEHQVPSASGELRWQRRVDRALFGPDSEIIVFQSVAHDITELKRTEATLRDSELRHRTLVEHAYDLICEIESAGRIHYASPRLDSLVGSPQGRLVARTLFDHAHPDDRDELEDLVARAVHDPSPATATIRLLDRDGQIRWVEWTCKAITGADGTSRRVLVGRDISERRAAEAEQQRLERAVRRAELLAAMGSLVGGVAHQVRNPLFAISSTLDAFQARFGEIDDYARYLTVLREQVDRMTLLMEQLLEFGKPGGTELSHQRLCPVVESAVRVAGERADRAQVRLELRMDESEAFRETRVRMMPDRLAIAFENLIDNAVQHSPPGERVTIVVEDGPEEGTVRIAVRDRGPGIAEDDVLSIFEPFFTRRRGGTGLGLSIVQRIVDAHEGKVFAHNDPAGGAWLEVHVPIASEEP